MATNVKTKNHTHGESYATNMAHKKSDRKVKGLHNPKSVPYRKPKYRITAYEYEYDEF